ncbi:unnamed protein product [Ectocarpus sp. 12 AP-2014]
MAAQQSDVGEGDAPLLRELDGMARNALKTQVEVSGSDDELLTVLAKFRHTLLGIPLPPPAPVDYDQALKDAQRESIEMNGRLFKGNVDELLKTLRGLIDPLVVGDETLTRAVCHDIIRASSRTASGGDAYAVMAALLSRPAKGDLLTPSGSGSSPIGISVAAADGEVIITVENSFVLRRNAMQGLGMGEPQQQSSSSSGEKGTLKERMVRAREQLVEHVEQTAEQFRKMTARKEVWGGPGWSVDDVGDGDGGGGGVSGSGGTKTPRNSPNGGEAAAAADAPAATDDEVDVYLNTSSKNPPLPLNQACLHRILVVKQ